MGKWFLFYFHLGGLNSRHREVKAYYVLTSMYFYNKGLVMLYKTFCLWKAQIVIHTHTHTQRERERDTDTHTQPYIHTVAPAKKSCVFKSQMSDFAECL